MELKVIIWLILLNTSQNIMLTECPKDLITFMIFYWYEQ